MRTYLLLISAALLACSPTVTEPPDAGGAGGQGGEPCVVLSLVVEHVECVTGTTCKGVCSHEGANGICCAIR